jgi:hypothetical protein
MILDKYNQNEKLFIKAGKMRNQQVVVDILSRITSFIRWFNNNAAKIIKENKRAK